MGTRKAKTPVASPNAVLLRRLAEQPSGVLLGLLGAAYEALDQRQRQSVFGDYLRPETPPAGDGKRLLRAIKRFHGDSLAGKYYAPFMWDSKSYMNVPHETEAWFDKMGKFLMDSVQLSQQGQHVEAVACFQVLYELIDALEDGDEIVFAHELGSWMIPVEERKTIAAYLKSLAAIASPEDYATVAVSLLKRDSRQSFADGVYVSAMRAAKKAQKVYLAAEIERQRVPTKPDKSSQRPRQRK